MQLVNLKFKILKIFMCDIENLTVRNNRKLGKR